MITLEVGKSYRLYGKMDTMKRMKPVGDSAFVTNLIYANIYTPISDEQVDAMNREMPSLMKQGTFEYREVKL